MWPTGHGWSTRYTINVIQYNVCRRVCFDQVEVYVVHLVYEYRRSVWLSRPPSFARPFTLWTVRIHTLEEGPFGSATGFPIYFSVDRTKKLSNNNLSDSILDANRKSFLKNIFIKNIWRVRESDYSKIVIYENYCHC